MNEFRKRTHFLEKNITRRLLAGLALITGLTWTLLGMTPVASAQATNSADEIVLTLDEAIEIALVKNNSLQNLRLDLENASSLIKEGWSELYPQIDVSSSFTRNVRSPDPFAGSQASGFFQTLGFIDWLTFNEQARTDSDPASSPISLPEFFRRQGDGLAEAGIVLELGDNPFSVPTVYRSGLSVTQKLFDGRVIYGAAGAQKWLPPFYENGVYRQEQLLITSVKNTFFQSLLAQEQVAVLKLSVDRADRTRKEMARQVSAGTAPKFQRLSAEVELANLETEYVQASNASASSLDDLKLLIGIPVEQSMMLRGSLEAALSADEGFGSIDEPAQIALRDRPDLKQALINIELERIQLKVTRSEFLPDLSAFLNLNYVGSIPDNRTVVGTEPGDPFKFSSTTNGYFDSIYWNWDMNMGFRLEWNLFNGSASKQRVQQRKIAVQKATLDHEYLSRSVRLEVDRAIRDVSDARIRLRTQEKNVDRASLNYSFIETRLREGVANPLELREASDQLDQSRLNFLQAVHDVLVARAMFETAIGMSSS
ncbi:MAG: TolC family protein [Bacteroidetes bacterium]|nr:MAG: TolC family protein [Bacteroidota bacterium]